MSFHVFFDFSVGLAHSIKAPKGTLRSIMDHVEHVEGTLGLKRTRYEDNPVYWDSSDPAYRSGFPDVPDDTLCKTVEEHNDWVRRLYQRLDEWREKPPADAETITPEDAQKFWHGLQRLDVKPARWTMEYFRARMESLYEIMRGRENEGVTFGAKSLTPQQAAAVIRIFDQYLDRHDLRLDVPDGHDYLASSYDGGYDWCEQCGKAKHPDDGAACRKRKCPLAAQARGDE